MKKPLEVLQECIVKALFWVSYHKKGKYGGPGQVVLNMKEEDREILRNLKSEDLEKLRPDSF